MRFNATRNTIEERAFVSNLLAANASMANASRYDESASGRTLYNYFRDYSPAYGRYVESDPIGLAGGVNTYGYVAGNPVTLTDPFGLVRWSGTAYTGGLVELVGASLTVLDLFSQCGADGKRWHIIVTAVGPAVGLGVKLSGTFSDVSFDDGLASADPNAFNGWYLGVSATATVGGNLNPQDPRVALGLPGPGITIGIGRYGRMTSDFSPKPGPAVGRDLSLVGVVGSSTVTFAESKDCICR